jgi:hypothetical protein
MKIKNWEKFVTTDEEPQKFEKKKPKSKRMLGEEWIKSGKKPVEKRRLRPE